MAAWVDDAAATAARLFVQPIDGFFFGQIIRIHILREILIHIEHVATPFDGDMLHRVLPFRIVVRIRRQIEADALLIQGRASQGHVIFPANERPHGAPGRLDDGEIRRRHVRIGPDVAFSASRLDFPVMGHELAVRREDDVAAIEGIARRVPLRHAEADIGIGFLGGCGDVGQVFADDDGFVIVALEIGALRVIAAADGEAEGQAVGIAWHERFGKDDELGSIAAGFADLGDDLLQSGVLIKHDGRCLDDSSAQILFQFSHISLLSYNGGKSPPFQGNAGKLSASAHKNAGQPLRLLRRQLP